MVERGVHDRGEARDRRRPPHQQRVDVRPGVPDAVAVAHEAVVDDGEPDQQDEDDDRGDDGDYHAPAQASRRASAQAVATPASGSACAMQTEP